MEQAPPACPFVKSTTNVQAALALLITNLHLFVRVTAGAPLSAKLTMPRRSANDDATKYAMTPAKRTGPTGLYSSSPINFCRKTYVAPAVPRPTTLIEEEGKGLVFGAEIESYYCMRAAEVGGGG